MFRCTHSLLCLLCVALVGAQEVRFNQLTSDDGLSSDNVTSFVQDHLGYMWIGTTDGLNRYDGRTVKIFRTKREGNCICGNNINLLQKDASGTIWVGTFDGGLCSLDPSDMSFTHYPVREQIRFSTEKVMSMAIESPNKIHIGYEKTNRMLLDVQSGQFHIFGDTTLLINGTDYSMFFSSSTASLYHSPIFIGLVREDVNGTTRITDPERKDTARTSDPFPGYTRNVIHEDKGGIIWCGAWDNALHRYDPRSGEVNYKTLDGGPIKFNENEILSIEDGSGQELWIGTRHDGLYLYNKLDGKFRKIRERMNDQGSPQGSTIESIYRDEQNRIWVGSEAGVSVHDPLLDQFNVYMPDEMTGKRVLELFHENDTLLIGHDEGLLLITDQEIVNKPLQHEGKKLQVGEIYPDIQGRILLGTNKSLFHWQPGSNSLSLVPKVVLSELELYHDIRSSHVSAIVEYNNSGKDHLLAFFFGYDLLVIDPATAHATPSLMGWEETHENLVRELIVDSKGRLWALGTSKGILQVIDPFVEDSIRKGDHISPHGYVNRHLLDVRSFFDAGAEGYTLTSHDVSDMVERPDGRFWVSTRGGGLFVFDPEDDVHTFIDMRSPINSLFEMVVDRTGDLWICTSSGLLRYHSADSTYKLFPKTYGIPSTGLNDNMMMDADGMIHAGGEGFYLRFDPTELRMNEHVAAVQLDGIEVNGELRNGLRSGDELKHNENFITFFFSAPNLTDPANNIYEYKLIGVDDDWHTTSSEVKAQYTSLPPGDHTLMLRAANNDGVGNDATEVFSFSIIPPWWNRWWFYSLVVLAIAAILYALYRYRIAQVRRLYEVRNTIAKDLHDDIGATLGSISIYSQVAKNKMGRSEKATEVIDMIGETSRSMVDRVGDIVWAVDPKNDVIDRSIKRMEDFATPLCTAKNIAFELHADEETRRAKLSMVQRKNLFLIYKEAIHNALKYAQAERIEVGLDLHNDQLKMNIRDNGIGFSTANSSAYNGNGLNNMRSRAGELNGDLQISSAENQGCTIELTFHV